MASSVINSDDGLVSGTSGIKTTGGDDGVLNIQSNGSTVVAVDGSGVSVTGTLSSSGGYGAVSATTLTVNSNNISADNSLGFRNRIINGDMRIDQRNAGASITPTATTYSVDRWQATVNVSSKASFDQTTTAPTGFNNSMLITSLSAYSVAAGDIVTYRQQIEGFNISDLGWGTSSAKTITVSFWVRSSLTGTFGGSVKNGGSNRSYPFTYTISVADTWEQKSVTIAGDTSGTWATDNTSGLILSFGIGVGSTTSGTAGAWAGTNYNSATGATSVLATNGATFYITGVQLEVGSVATPFERRPYGTELALCQRYFTKFGSGVAFEAYSMGEATGSTSIRFLMQCPVVMRSSPTLSVGGSGLVWSLDRVGTALSSFSLTQATTQIQSITANTANNITAGQVGSVTAGNFTNTSVSFSSEL
jgi:hypothetical protein